MDVRINELVEFAKKKFGLNNYYLQDYQFYRSINFFNETVYTLSMEWFPNHAVLEEDGSNPEGTASIELDITSRKIKSAIFVMGKSFAIDGVKFSNNKDDVIKWVENETGLQFGTQFNIHKENEGEFYFMACVDGVSVSPSGYIDVKFNADGKLTLFSIHGQFPSKNLIKEGKFTLTLDRLGDLKKEQLKLIESHLYDQKKIIYIYAMEEIFVTNDGETTIKFEAFADKSQFLKINQTIYWDEPINKPFKRKKIRWVEELTAEQAFSCEPSPDSFPITKVDQEKCMMAVKNLLRMEYPNESGNWILNFLYRDKGYIHVTLKENKQNNRLFQRKIKVMIDGTSLQVVNYMDSKLLLNVFDNFQEPPLITISKDQAYQKLKQFFELRPFYVYDLNRKHYVLCGKLDCHYGVNATSGEVRALDDL
ncbi:hypothetical protein EBB45_04195 [Lysinibacillus composti]|uniref:DUF4901 domain-containing protein n=1 Tax=Lysinibacillus composti TaxID=720633 RepID=A0A3N9UJ22_9BACI|nr:hypothetical protein EBB45_04195 [Lysinibacillus composti]